MLRIYRDSGAFAEDSSFLASFRDGNLVSRCLFFARFLGLFLWKLASNNQIRVVHIHMSSRGSYFRKALVAEIAKVAKKKVILHVHGSEFEVFYRESFALVKRCIRRTLSMSDVVVALSEQWRHSLSRMSGRDNVRILYNPAVVGPYLEREDSGTVNFLFLGRMGVRKGVFDLVEAVALMRRSNVRVFVYGDGDVEGVREHVLRFAVSSKVCVAGWISGSEKTAILKSAHVLVLPSYHEGLPMSVLEAMSWGLPVLATDVGGISEAVEHGRTGFLVEPGDKDGLAKRMDELASSHELRRAMGKAGYGAAKTKFSVEVVLDALRQMHASLLEGSR